MVLSSNCEGLSLPVSEGMAAGKPVVGSNVPDVRALVRGTGLIFEKGGDTGMDLPQEGHFGRENFCAFWNRKLSRNVCGLCERIVDYRICRDRCCRRWKSHT